MGFPELFLGCLAGLVAGYAPGINGRIGLVMALPFALSLGPEKAIVFLVAMHSVIHTTSSIPAVLFGAPTSATEAATAVDGIPLARKSPARAAGLVINASFFGGIFGAAGLWLLIPVFTFCLSSIASPEFLALGILGMLSIAGLSGPSLAAGLAMGSLGWLCSIVGMDPLTGGQRLTFGQPELFDGLSTVALVTGLFSVPELLRARAPQSSVQAQLGWRALMEMIASFGEVIRSWGVTVIASAIGFWIGFIPGIGASAAVWLAYAQARTQSKRGSNFGNGEPDGIIAPEAANNSKEGGAFAPLLFLGIPGTTSLAVMVDVFDRAGIELGPNLLTRHSAIAATVALTIFAANVIATPLSWLTVPLITRYTLRFQEQIRIFALLFSVVVVMLEAGLTSGALQLAVFSLIGMLAARAGMARAPMLLGFIMGPVIEKMLIRTVSIYGLSAFSRPGVLLICGIGVICMVYFYRMKSKVEKAEVLLPSASIVMAGIAAFMAIAIWPVHSMHSQMRLLPMLAIAVGIVTSLVCLIRLLRAGLPGWGNWQDAREGLIFLLVALSGCILPFQFAGAAYSIYLLRQRCAVSPAIAALGGLTVLAVIHWTLP